MAEIRIKIFSIVTQIQKNSLGVLLIISINQKITKSEMKVEKIVFTTLLKIISL